MKNLFILLLLFSSAVIAQTKTMKVSPDSILRKVTEDSSVLDLTKIIAQLNSGTLINLGQSNQIATDQADIVVLKATVANMGSGISYRAQRTVSAASYIVTQADNFSIIKFATKCTVTFSPTLVVPFECSIVMQGTTTAGQVTFSGIGINSPNGWKKIKYQWGRVDVACTSTGIVSLNGDLKY